MKKLQILIIKKLIMKTRLSKMKNLKSIKLKYCIGYLIDVGDVHPSPGVDRVDGRLDVLPVPHDQGQLVLHRGPRATRGSRFAAGLRHGDVAGQQGCLPGLVDDGLCRLGF